MPLTISSGAMKYRDDNGDYQTLDCLKGDKGDPGDPTELIDDTASTGDTNKVWSADKTNTEVNTLKNAINAKQDAPETAGTAGQVLSLDNDLEPVWVNQSGGGSFDGEFVLDVAQQSATLGEELASGTGWVLGTGWTGDFTNGFTHSSGTDALEFPITGNESGKMYLVSFTSTVDATVTPNFYVTIGDSDLFPLYGMPQPYRVGIISKGTANLKFIPITSFTGKIADVSIKEVTQFSVPYMVVVDADGDNTLEYRSTDRDQHCVFIGRNAGKWNVTGFGNTAVGDDTLTKVIGGFWNTAMGLTALRDNETGSRNVGVGYGALQANIAGHRNIAVGTFSLITNTTGYQNVAVGADSMDKNTTGYNNVALGFQAMYNNTSGYENVAIGNNTAEHLTTGYRNIVIGQRTLGAITEQSYNIGMGYSVMPSTTGSYNVGIGMNTLYHNTGGQYNVAIGFQAGYGSNNASQTRNVFIGPQAGLNVYNSVSNNVLIGYQAGSTLVKGSENVCIGHGADVPASNTDNYTNINGQVKGSKVTGSEWTQVLGDLIVMGKDGVKRQIVFNNDNTVSWTTVS